MRVDYALILTVLAMVLLVLLKQPALALLAGLLGILVIGATGETYRRFEDVGVPEAGDYPKWDFWKEVLEKSGEFLGKQSKTFLRTEQLVDQWSSWMKKKVYGAESSKIWMFGPYATNLPEDYIKIGGATALLQQLDKIAAYKGALIAKLSDPNLPADLRNAVKKELELVEKIEEKYKEKLEDLLKKED